MANFKPITITNKGLQLVQEATQNGGLNFTRVVIGSGTKEEKNILTAEKLEAFAANLTTEGVEYIGKGQYKITARFNNAEPDKIETGFHFKELGLYAQLKYNNSETAEVLFGYTTVAAAEQGDYIPSYKEYTMFEERFEILVLVENVADVNATFTYKLEASQIQYTAKDPSISNSSVQAAIDELYDEVSNVILVSKTKPQNQKTGHWWYELV